MNISIFDCNQIYIFCCFRLDAYYTLDIKNQISKILSLSPKLSNRSELNEENGQFIKDIIDGRIYKNSIIDIEHNNHKKENVITLTINTDGISPCSKSKLKIWPVFLVINELPIETRYSLENVILAGTFYFILFNLIKIWLSLKLFSQICF
jgi:hypothetical protein